MNRILLIVLGLLTLLLICLTGCQIKRPSSTMVPLPPTTGRIVERQTALPRAAVVPGLTNVVLAWNRSPGTNAIVDYRVYYGTVSRFYVQGVSAGTNLSVTIPVASGTNWFFAATATDDMGRESGYSNEAELYAKAKTNRLVTVTSVVAPAINGPWTANTAWRVIYLTNPPATYYKNIVTVTNY